MKPRFLLDENLPPHLKTALLHHDESIDVLRVGDSGAPPLATPAPLILRYVDTAQRCLVTDNRHSMPRHLVALGCGRTHLGPRVDTSQGFYRANSKSLVCNLEFE
ncbi:MAG: DUF5615 family PIN-like protein [Thermoflexales bacterium]|nr:DUF5615 family PIN-like protein [Thermoflexales bacterium]